MKHLYIFALAASLAFTACSDFLEQDNKSNVPTEEFYNTANGFASLTNSAYSSLRTIYSAQPQL